VTFRGIFVAALVLGIAGAAIVVRTAPLAPVAPVAPSAPVFQSDLDDFMSRVLTRRDENWKKLQQYVLEEDERFQLLGPGGNRLYGFNREYTWFIRQGYFIRSPLKFDGVKISEEERARDEQRWIEREKSREKRAADEKQHGEIRVTGGGDVRLEESPASQPAPEAPASVEDVLKIEYYPSKLFTEGRSRPNKKVRDRDDEIEEKMNKVSLVTMWIDPAEHQILQYTFDNMDMDFLPARSLVRVDELKASMTMLEPFPSVWLPGTIDMRFFVTTAVGSIDARYDVEYRDYRLAEVTTRIRP
jgi:hypothetical protein